MCGPMLARLPHGRIIAFGGVRYPRDDIRRTHAAAVYHPRTERRTRTGSLITARSEAAVAPLPHGRILVAGGYGPRLCVQMDSVEIYHSRSGRWTHTAPLDHAREVLRQPYCLMAMFWSWAVPSAEAKSHR